MGRWQQADPYDEFASPYLGMGGDPVNNVDPDGGSINPLITMAVAGAATYLIAKNNGAGGLGLAAATIGGALLGGGLVHASLASLTADEGALFGGNKNLWQNIKAFYVGVFTNRGSSVATNSLERYASTKNQAIIPNVWGWLGGGNDVAIAEPFIPISTPQAISNTATPNTLRKLSMEPPNPLPGGGTGSPGGLNGRNAPNVKPGQPPCLCPQQVPTGRFNLIPFNFPLDIRNGPDPVGTSFEGLGLSDEEFSAATSLGSQLASMVRPGDIVRATIVQQLQWVNQIPVNDVPNVSGGFITVNPKTGRRVDFPTAGNYILQPKNPRIFGMTSSQIWDAQTTLMANMIQRRFGGSRVTPLPTT